MKAEFTDVYHSIGLHSDGQFVNDVKLPVGIAGQQ
jgi:hypothetical protein